jgi:hypothetical protein
MTKFVEMKWKAEILKELCSYKVKFKAPLFEHCGCPGNITVKNTEALTFLALAHGLIWYLSTANGSCSKYL